MKVLVAEDSSLLRRQIAHLFSELPGIELVGGMRGALDACLAVGELKPDVVILDILMSGGNGIDSLRKIKLQDTQPVVIVLTDRTSPPYRARAAEAGADFFLDKATEFGRIREIIQELVRSGSSTLKEGFAL